MKLALISPQLKCNWTGYLSRCSLLWKRTRSSIYFYKANSFYHFDSKFKNHLVLLSRKISSWLVFSIFRKCVRSVGVTKTLIFTRQNQREKRVLPWRCERCEHSVRSFRHRQRNQKNQVFWIHDYFFIFKSYMRITESRGRGHIMSITRWSRKNGGTGSDAMGTLTSASVLHAIAWVTKRTRKECPTLLNCNSLNKEKRIELPLLLLFFKVSCPAVKLVIFY